MADMQDMLNEASLRLQDAARRAGMSGVGDVVSKLDNIKENASKGHDSVLQKVVAIFNEFQMTLEKALADPSKLGPGGECAAPLAKCYGDTVAKRLAGIKSEGSQIIELFKDLSQSISSLLNEVSKTMQGAMPCISNEVKELLELPNLLAGFAGEVEKKGPKAIATLNMEAVNKSLDVTPMHAPLDNIDAIKGTVGPQIEETQKGVQRLATFKASVPNKVRNAFNVFPCIPVTKHAPSVMQELLAKLDALKDVDLAPLVDMLTKMKSHINKFESQKVKAPLSDYSERAKEILQPLTTAVEEAKKVAGAGQLIQGGTDALMKGDMKGFNTAMASSFKSMF